MTTLFAISRRFFVTAAAFGLATLGIAGAASADPAATTTFHVETGVGVDAHARRGERPDVVRYDRGGYDRGGYDRGSDDRGGYDRGTYGRYGRDVRDPYQRAMWRFDSNRNGRIEGGEQRAYWQFMVGTGTYGQLSSDEAGRFVQLVHLFDTNKDGRLVGPEWTGMDLLIDSLRQFKRLDRNGDRRLSAFEVGFSSMAPRFYRADLNRDHRLSQQEVRDDVLRAFRNGECG